jgi:Holliday junction resolvase RusA-like endonuclease
MNGFQFQCNIKPVSTNMAVRHGKNGSYKSKTLADFLKEISIRLKSVEPINIDDKKPVTMSITFTIPENEFFTKKGFIAKKHDIDNLQKYTIDSIAKYLNFNDALITELHSKKHMETSGRLR